MPAKTVKAVIGRSARAEDKYLYQAETSYPTRLDQVLVPHELLSSRREGATTDISRKNYPGQRTHDIMPL